MLLIILAINWHMIFCLLRQLRTDVYRIYLWFTGIVSSSSLSYNRRQFKKVETAWKRLVPRACRRQIIRALWILSKFRSWRHLREPEACVLVCLIKRKTNLRCGLVLLGLLVSDGSCCGTKDNIFIYSYLGFLKGRTDPWGFQLNIKPFRIVSIVCDSQDRTIYLSCDKRDLRSSHIAGSFNPHDEST